MFMPHGNNTAADQTVNKHSLKVPLSFALSDSMIIDIFTLCR